MFVFNFGNTFVTLE